MTPTPRHQRVEDRMRALLASADLPAPDEVAHLSRAVIFIWYATKAFVLVDLEELPPGADPLAGLDVTQLGIDLDPTGGPDCPPGFIEAA